ncbi:efflux RND transporter periplasmic adaptor subunit [Leadbetterella byssophila]|uniref:efflux RND transporter periplasmic adaptor subunit n=1 Tax=Leadbetterella byssophila TaxID=316068 RepID=UPI0039A3BD5B
MKRLVILLLLSACQKPEVKETEEVHEAFEARLTDTQLATAKVEYGKIEEKNLTSSLRLNGVLRVPNTHKGSISALYGGVVKTLLIEMGDPVKKGQIIAYIEHPDLIKLQEEYLMSSARLEQTEEEFKRQLQLVEGQAGAIKTLQASKSEYLATKAKFQSLEAQINLLGLSGVKEGKMYASLPVRSPIHGTISTIYAKMGEFLNVAAPLAEVVDNNALHLDLQVFEKDLHKMKIGQKVRFTLTNLPTEAYDAEVFSIGSSFENDSKTIAVHCKVTGPVKGLIDGMNVSARVETSTDNQKAVLNDAIVEAEGKTFIIIEEEKGVFERVEVIKGVTDLGYTAVMPVKDLAEKTRIVTKGAYFVHAAMVKSEGHTH